MIQEEASPSATGDRRSATRFDASALPGARVRIDLAHGEAMNLAISALSRDGLTLHCAQPGAVIEPGTSVRGLVTLPLCGRFSITMRVTSCGAHERGVRIGVQFVDPLPALTEAIAEYILAAHADTTPRALRTAGYVVGSIDRALVVDHAATPEDLEAIAALRLAAYRSEGRLATRSASDLRTPFDEYSHYIILRHGLRIVGCWRMIFVDRDPARSQYVSLGDHRIPEHVWDAGFLEGGGGAMHPDYQRTGMFVRLAELAMTVAVANGHRFVVGASEPHLWPMYRDLGAEFLEERRVHPAPGWEMQSMLFLWDLDRLLVDPHPGKHAGRIAAAIRSARQTVRIASVRVGARGNASTEHRDVAGVLL